MKNDTPHSAASQSAISQSMDRKRSASDSEFVSDIIDEVTERLVRGESIDVEAYIRRHPDHATQLRKLLETLALLHDGSPAIDNRSDVFENNAESSKPQGTLAESPIPRDVTSIGAIGEFTIIRELGRGGMGIVYEATQMTLGRRVALKILPFAATFDERRLKRFHNEARAAAMLKHPGIVSVHSVGCDHAVHYYVMEMIDGQTLASLTTCRNSARPDETHEPSSAAADQYPLAPNLSPAAPLRARGLGAGATNADTSPFAVLTTSFHNDRKSFHRSIARLGVQAAEALDYAHQEGVLHRDIKPSNLMIDQHGKLHITDFGLARIQSAEDLTLSGDLVGTLRYMSPEQLDGRQVADQRTDVYSLGITLYELLAQRPAFNAMTHAELMSQITEREPASLPSVDATIPHDLAKIVAKSIAKDPAHRYSTAQEFGEDLNRFLENKPVLARRTSAVQRTWRWCRRNRSKAALIGLVTTILLALAVGGPVVAFQQAEQKRTQTELAERRRVELYESDMAQIQRHIDDGDIEQAVQILNSYAPVDNKSDEPNQQNERDLRQFEWYELLGQCQRRLNAITIKTGYPSWGLDWSPNGELAVNVYFGGPIVVDPLSSQTKWSASDHGRFLAEPYDVEFTPDATALMMIYGSKWIELWDASTGKPICASRVEENGRSVAVSRDGLVALAISGEDKIRMPGRLPGHVNVYQLADLLANNDSDHSPNTDLVKPVAVLNGPIGRIRDVCFSADGTQLAATSHDGTLHIWDAKTFQSQRVLQQPNGTLMCAAFSPDGRYVCGGGGRFDTQWRSGEATVWDAETGDLVAVILHGTCVKAVDFTPNGQLITGGREGRIAIWDIATQQQTEEINAHADNVSRLQVSPDGTRFASSGDDNTARIWSLAATVPPTVAWHTDLKNYSDLDFSPGSKYLVTSAYSGIAIWNATTSKLLHRTSVPSLYANGISFAPDGQRFASIHSPWPWDPAKGSDLNVWDLNGQLQSTTHFDDLTHARGVAYAPGGKHIAVSAGIKALLWNIATQTVDARAECRDGYHLVFSPDGKYLASPHEIFKYPSLEPHLTFKSTRAGFAIDFDPNGHRFATSDPPDGTITIRSLADGEVLQELNGHTDVVLFLDYSPDGKRLISGGQSGTSILWNLETGDEILRYRDHQFWVRGTKFSPDGQILASTASGTLDFPCIVFRRTIDASLAGPLLKRAEALGMGNRE